MTPDELKARQEQVLARADAILKRIGRMEFPSTTLPENDSAQVTAVAVLHAAIVLLMQSGIPASVSGAILGVTYALGEKIERTSILDELRKQVNEYMLLNMDTGGRTH